MPKHGKQYRNTIEGLNRSVLMTLEDTIKNVIKNMVLRL